MATEWAVEYMPNDSDTLKVVRGFVSQQEALKWVEAENIYDRGTDVDVYRVQ